MTVTKNGRAELLRVAREIALDLSFIGPRQPIDSATHLRACSLLGSDSPLQIWFNRSDGSLRSALRALLGHLGRVAAASGPYETGIDGVSVAREAAEQIPRICDRIDQLYKPGKGLRELGEDALNDKSVSLAVFRCVYGKDRFVSWSIISQYRGTARDSNKFDPANCERALRNANKALVDLGIQFAISQKKGVKLSKVG